MKSSEGTDLRTEAARLARDIDAAKDAIRDALRSGAATAALRHELAEVEARRAEIVHRIAAAAEAAEADAAEYIDAECEALVAKIRTGIDSLLAQLEPSPQL